MPMQETPGNDGGLLNVMGGIRRTLDQMVEDFATHSERHPDHQITECPGLTLLFAHRFMGISASAGHTANNLMERHLELAYGDDEDPDAPTDFYPL